MIQRLTHTSVWVLDQERAKRFYTEILGFELREDQSMGGFRWLTVSPKGQPDLELVLMPVGTSPMVDEQTAKTLRELVEKGTFGGGVLETADCKQSYAELKEKGVVFLSEPQERPYGIEALLKDDSGNWFSLVQRRK